MKTPAQYQHELAALDAEGIKTDGLSEAEAAQSLEKVKDVEEKLKQIDNGLGLDIHALRAQFQGRMASLNIANQRKGGKARTEEEQRLHEERDSKLAPYEEIKKRVDELMEKVGNIRSDLERAVPGSMQGKAKV